MKTTSRSGSRDRFESDAFVTRTRIDCNSPHRIMLNYNAVEAQHDIILLAQQRAIKPRYLKGLCRIFLQRHANTFNHVRG